ncbi:hypothetical protein BASA60_005354 [Batrachochytrium salamandrivorans]|nr:hypothetical protein BASA60_005354 [Batrachochytrium salamandrivorans]
MSCLPSRVFTFLAASVSAVATGASQLLTSTDDNSTSVQNTRSCSGSISVSLTSDSGSFAGNRGCSHSGCLLDYEDELARLIDTRIKRFSRSKLRGPRACGSTGRCCLKLLKIMLKRTTGVPAMAEMVSKAPH